MGKKTCFEFKNIFLRSSKTFAMFNADDACLSKWLTNDTEGNSRLNGYKSHHGNGN
jgi:hypothetical protein